MTPEAGEGYLWRLLASVEAARKGDLLAPMPEGEGVAGEVSRNLGELLRLVRTSGSAADGEPHDHHQRQLELQKAVSSIYRRSLRCRDIDQLAATCLEQVLELTSSSSGFIGELDEDGRVKMIAFAEEGQVSCAVSPELREGLFHGQQVRGIWGEVLSAGRSLITNEPGAHPVHADVPEGHIPLRCFLGVPLKQGGKTVGLMALANKATGYTPVDREAVEQAAVAVIEAMRCKRAALKQQKHHTDIHVAIQESVAELMNSNRALRQELQQRQEVEQQLRQIEGRYRSLVEATTEVVWSADGRGRFVLPQPLWEAHTGQAREYYEGRGWLEAFHEDDRQRIRRAFEPVGETAAPLEAEGRLWNTRRSSYRYCALRGVPLCDDQGQVLEWLGTITEIHQRWLAEREITIRNRISRVFLTVPDRQMYGEVIQVILHAVDSPFGVFGYVDAAGSLVCPTVPEQTRKQSLDASHTMEFSRTSMAGVWQRALDEKQTILCNDPQPEEPGGDLPPRSLSVPVLHQGTAVGLLHLAGKATDYDELDRQQLEALARYIAPVLDARLKREGHEKQRQEAEQALEAKARELERSNMELSQFAYVASHDLQEPLRMVASYTELLRQQYGGQLDHEADTYIDYAVEGALRMRDLINGLLDYSRVESHTSPLTPTSLDEVLDEVLHSLQLPLRQSGAQLERGELPVVYADTGQLARLLQNLLSNAIKFCEDEPPRVRISALRMRKEWVVSVRDHGIGIEPQYQDQIFQIFKRLHPRRAYQGNGIGLAVARRIVERHDGRIWLESEPGEGSTFFFTMKEVPQ